MRDCIFCKIINNEVSSYKIYEDQHFLAFLDISQFTSGHTLIIPKKHIEFVWDMDNIEDFYKFASKVANHFRSIGYKYVDSFTFGRKVPHAHLHLVPHDGDSSDYQNAISALGEMQGDTNRRLDEEKMRLILNEFVLKN